VTARVWVGCLGCYNGGRLVGTWIDAVEANLTMTSWVEHGGRVPADHAVEAHEELWVMDFECMPFLDGESSPAEAQRIGESWRGCSRIGPDVRWSASMCRLRSPEPGTSSVCRACTFTISAMRALHVQRMCRARRSRTSWTAAVTARSGPR
jgi:Antirestriction protein (ArdA)